MHHQTRVSLCFRIFYISNHSNTPWEQQFITIAQHWTRVLLRSWKRKQLLVLVTTAPAQAGRLRMDLGKVKLLRTGINTLHQAIHPVHGIAWTDGKQGCVWHPKLDVLAVLTKKDTSVLFSVRVDNRRIKADIKGSGLIHCACWTKDGTRLVVAIGSALHSYIWNDVQKSIVACSFCPIFDVGGYVCAIESTGEAQVTVATELPLDKICGLNAGMSFDLPNEGESIQSQEISEEDSVLDRRRSFSERSYLPTAGPLDLTHLLARHRRSEPSILLHLRRRDTLTGSGQDSSHLILVTYERKVTTTRKVSIPGILVPDIIAFDPRCSTVAVASNTSNMVLVYCITPSAMPNIQQISLQANDRPKGVCFLSDKMLLLMIGRQKSNDPAFLPASNTDKYMLRLLAKELLNEGEIPTNPPPMGNPSPSMGPGIRRHSEHISKEDRERPVGIKDLVLPGGGVVRSPANRRRLIEEVRSREASPITSSVDFSDRVSDKTQSSSSSITLENYDMEQVSRLNSLAVAGQASRDSSRASSPRLEPSDKLHADPGLPLGDRKAIQRERALEQLVHNMERLFSRFSDVQQCMADMRDFTQNGKKAQSVYPHYTEPSYVNVTCQKQLSENVFIDERRPVLLCDGKLCLRALQELFSLSAVEMMYGPLWIVLVADHDGFVPLTFKSKDELTVRNGKRKSTMRTPETSCPPSPAPSPSTTETCT
uniref:WD repeat and coiled-coil-containing protein n=1 Tax=Knipowitschia caucasica TaxID=637954 RepID=A0AAV2KES7_KNICA